MASSRSRRAKLKRLRSAAHDGTPSDELLAGLHPKQAAGMTEGLTAEEYFERFPADPGVDQISHLLKGEVRYVEGTRIPVPTFVAHDDPNTWWTDGTDRMQRGHNAAFPKHNLDAMRAGHMCMMCYEPLLESFPLKCPLCGYEVRERQIVDLAVQVEGETWIGPTKAVQEYLEEIEVRAEKQRFDQKIAAGASKLKGLVRRG